MTEPKVENHCPNPRADADLEAALLLANIDSAVRSLDKADLETDQHKVVSRLELALHTYGSVKHLLPKLNFSAAQRAPIERLLHELRTRILNCKWIPE